MTDDRTPTAETIRDRIRHLLGNNLLIPSEKMDIDLVENGVVDSADFMSLFLLIENEFGIVVEAADLVFDNFRTTDRMTAFVMSKILRREVRSSE